MPLSARLVLVFVGLLTACGSRPPLPAPEHPLVRTLEAPELAKPPPLTAADPEHIEVASESAKLPNGLTLLVATQKHLPYVALSFATRGAGRFDGVCSPELLRLTARAVVEGGTIWTDGSVVEPLRVHGRGVDFEVAADHTHFDLSVLRESLPAGLTVLARTVQKPSFSGGLDPVRVHELDALKSSSDGVDSQLVKLGAAGSYGDDFAAQLVPSKLDAVREASDAAIRRCYEESIAPETSALIAVGDITLAELRELATPHFMSWPGTGRSLGAPAAAPEPTSNGLQVHWLVAGDSAQSRVVLLQPAPTQHQPDDEVPFALLSEIAVGATRSRSNNTLRHDRGVTYGLQPELIHGRSVGLLLVKVSFEINATADAIRSLLQTLEELQNKPVSETELKDAKRRFLYRVAFRVGSHEGLAKYLGELFSQGKDVSWLGQLERSLAAIQPADLQRVAKRYLRPGDTDLGVYGDWAMRNQLAFLGRVTTYRAALE